MANLVCVVCRQPPGDGKNCQHCSGSLAEPGAIIDLDAQPTAPRQAPVKPTPRTRTMDTATIPAAPAPSRTCSEPGCPNVPSRANLLCDAHRDQRAARAHQNYSLRCTKGFDVEVPDGTSVTLGRSAAASPYAEQLTDFGTVSRRHATFTSRDGALTVVDHKSRNGTRAAGVDVVPETPKVLVPGDQVVLGHEVTLYVR